MIYLCSDAPNINYLFNCKKVSESVSLETTSILAKKFNSHFHRKGIKLHTVLKYYQPGMRLHRTLNAVNDEDKMLHLHALVIRPFLYICS